MHDAHEMRQQLGYYFTLPPAPLRLPLASMLGSIRWRRAALRSEQEGVFLSSVHVGTVLVCVALPGCFGQPDVTKEGREAGLYEGASIGKENIWAVADICLDSAPIMRDRGPWDCQVRRR